MTAGVVIVIFHTVKVGFRLCNDTNTAADPDVVFSLIVEPKSDFYDLMCNKNMIDRVLNISIFSFPTLSRFSR